MRVHGLTHGVRCFLDKEAGTATRDEVRVVDGVGHDVKDVRGITSWRPTPKVPSVHKRV